MGWFSTNARLVCVIEGEGAVEYMDCVHLFQANEYADAQLRALELGRTQEQEYRNGEGKLVRWRLKELVSLDAVVADLDGAEVYSQPTPLEDGVEIPFDTVFRPEDSDPTSSI